MKYLIKNFGLTALALAIMFLSMQVEELHSDHTFCKLESVKLQQLASSIPVKVRRSMP